MAAVPPPARLGVPAPAFDLPATDGARYSLADIMGDKGAVVVFICNHCPYVKASIDRMVADARVLAKDGIGFAAICSNDSRTHPADSYDNMKRFAQDHGFGFPYLHDESQEVARAWEAVCTPDYFGLNAAGEIVYRGRLDAGRAEPVPADTPRDLVAAMRQVARTGAAPAEQIPSMGCSIKWREAG